MASEPHVVTGTYTPRGLARLRGHHHGWDEAFEDALKKIGIPKGDYHGRVEFSARIRVYNPGGVIEYITTLTVTPSGGG
jgi:hypothetical protein